MFIYKITNNVNGKVYIGQTIRTITCRWLAHCNKKSSCSAMAKAINKYGKDSFSVETIEICNDIETLNEREIYWIAFYKSLAPNGYNLNTGGLNYTVSEETKQKLRKPKHPDFGKKLSIAKTGTKRPEFSKEWRENIGKAHSGEKNYMFGKIGFGAKKIKCLNTNQIFNSISEASRILDLFSQSISAVLNGKYMHTKGYKFIFVGDDNG